MRGKIRRWVVKHFDDLLTIDLTLARILGAPAPHTLSSYARLRELEGRGSGWRKFIDFWYGWFVMGEINHCEKDFRRVAKDGSDRQ